MSGPISRENITKEQQSNPVFMAGYNQALDDVAASLAGLNSDRFLDLLRRRGVAVLAGDSIDKARGAL